ncbi:TPA: hypothetical protein ACH3X1_000594 [Trebouxia sp. C0004]
MTTSRLTSPAERGMTKCWEWRSLIDISGPPRSTRQHSRALQHLDLFYLTVDLRGNVADMSDLHTLERKHCLGRSRLDILACSSPQSQHMESNPEVSTFTLWNQPSVGSFTKHEALGPDRLPGSPDPLCRVFTGKCLVVSHDLFTMRLLCS